MQSTSQFIFGLGASLSFSLAFTQYLMADHSRLEPFRRRMFLAISLVTASLGVGCTILFFTFKS